MKSMKTIRMAIVMVLVFTSLAVFGCGDSGPKTAIDTFMSGAKDKDCVKMVDVIDIQTMQDQDSSITRDALVESCKQSSLDEVVSYNVVAEKVEGDKAEATVEVTTKKDGQ